LSKLNELGGTKSIIAALKTDQFVINILGIYQLMFRMV